MPAIAAFDDMRYVSQRLLRWQSDDLCQHSRAFALREAGARRGVMTDEFGRTGPVAQPRVAFLVIWSLPPLAGHPSGLGPIRAWMPTYLDTWTDCLNDISGKSPEDVFESQESRDPRPQVRGGSLRQYDITWGSEHFHETGKGHGSGNNETDIDSITRRGTSYRQYDPREWVPSMQGHGQLDPRCFGHVPTLFTCPVRGSYARL
jgi:hypothetical protein